MRATIACLGLGQMMLAWAFLRHLRLYHRPPTDADE